MPDILEGPLDPGVTPHGVLFCHPHDQPADLGENTTAAQPPVRIRPLSDHQLPMPAQNRVWSHEGGNLTQYPSSQSMPHDGQSTPFAIGELALLPAQLTAEDAILLPQVRERLPFPTIQPPGQNREHHLESRRVDHDGSLSHGARSACLGSVG
jgi:hypothetical protein